MSAAVVAPVRSSSSPLIVRHRAAARPLPGRGLRRRGTAPGRPGLRAGRAAHLPRRAGSTRAASSAGRPTPARCWPSALVSVLVALRAAAPPGLAPVQPDGRAGGRPARWSFNTAVSFVTNTNWQNYGGEIDDEPPHPDGRPGGAELRLGRGRHGRGGRPHPGPGPPRGRRRSATSGSTSPAATVRILLPLVVRGRRWCFVSQGVIQNFDGFTDGHDASRGRRRSIPGGPVASQEAIKELGTNGGGFFNANSAHPFENPNGVHQLPGDLRDRSSSRSPSPSPSGAWSRTAARAGPSSRVMFVLWAGTSLLATGARDRRQPAT